MTAVRGRWLVVGLSLLVGAAVAWLSLGEVVGASCVWANGADGAHVERFLRDWLAQRHGPVLSSWDVSVDPRTAHIDLTTDAGHYGIELTLAATCWTQPQVRLVQPIAGAAFPAPRDLAALADGFPIPKRGTAPADAALVAVILMVACVGLGVAASSPSSAATWSGMARHAGWVLPLVVLAAWPIMFVPFDTDAPASRAAFAAVDVFGDWNHPFLPYLLNRPTTWFSLEPWSLRLVPLAFLCAETVLTMVVAGDAGGRLAGALAATWFVCEIRRRHGLYDLSDWDFAGTFLMALLLVLQRCERVGWRGALVLCAIMACGVLSSWLMIVVAGVLVGCLGLEAARGRTTVGPVVIVGVAFVVLAGLALHVFATGSGQAALFPVDEVIRQMFAETPVGRSLAMAVPVALGLGWLVQHRDQLGPRFAGLCLLAVPAAIYVAQQHSHVNGGYYVGLVTPLLVYAAAAATGRIIEALVAWGGAPGGGGAASWTVPMMRAVLVLAVAGGTLRAMGTGRMGEGAEDLAVLARDTRAEQSPIFTNAPSLVPLLAYERARAGVGALADVIGAGPADLVPRIHLLQRDECVGRLDSATTHFYLVYLASDDRDARRACVERLGARCRPLSATTAGDDRSNWVLRCDGNPPGSG